MESMPAWLHVNMTESVTERERESVCVSERESVCVSERERDRWIDID